MSTIQLYCSVGFLEALYDKINKPLLDWVEDHDSENIRKLYRLIHQQAEIILDRDINDLINQKSKTYNPNFKKLIKNKSLPEIRSGDFRSIKNKEKEFFANQISPSAILLTDFSIAVTDQIRENFGIISYSREEICETQFMFNSGLEHFQANSPKTWNFILSYRHPFNALVLSDAFILSKKEGRKNLKDLLLHILPKSLIIPFDLTIISSRESNGMPSDLNAVFDELLDFLKKNFTYDFNLTLILKKIHDRNFLTNYLWCNSGYGFQLIENDLAKYNTHLTLLPVTFISNSLPVNNIVGLDVADKENQVLNFIKARKEEYRKALLETPEKIGLQINAIGSRNNRLLANKGILI